MKNYLYVLECFSVRFGVFWIGMYARYFQRVCVYSLGIHGLCTQFCLLTTTDWHLILFYSIYTCTPRVFLGHGWHDCEVAIASLCCINCWDWKDAFLIISSSTKSQSQTCLNVYSWYRDISFWTRSGMVWVLPSTADPSLKKASQRNCEKNGNAKSSTRNSWFLEASRSAMMSHFKSSSTRCKTLLILQFHQFCRWHTTQSMGKPFIYSYHWNLGYMQVYSIRDW